MRRFISALFIMLFLCGNGFALDFYEIGDSVFFPIVSGDTWSSGDTLKNAATFPDSVIAVGWHYAHWDTLSSPDDYKLIRTYVADKDSIRTINFPVKSLSTPSGQQSGYYFYCNRADFAGKAGVYMIRWMLRISASKQTRGEYIYRVASENVDDCEKALSALREIENSGTHWSPTGSIYGGESVMRNFAGRGPHICELVLLNSADSSAVSKCDIKIYNADDNAVEGLWYTSARGVASFSLMNGNYNVIPFKSGYSFPELPYEIEINDSSLTDTIWASSFHPGSPPSASLCRVYGWILGAGYDSLTGVTVQARLKQSPVRLGNVIISPYEKITETDTSGYWYLDLLPNDSLTPEGTSYLFTIYYSSGTVARKEIMVPDSSSWEFRW
ncbi:MAG: hypothetical protein GF307_11770 [candidate division Zixibacteria bacterium]|nr:hypothetical protein [candidate division Zixibacteria bacterium]